MKLTEAINALPLVAIVRGVHPEQSLAVGEALRVRGVRAMEVPLNSPDALVSIRLLAGRYGLELAIGAGTVLSVEDVDDVRNAGGSFVVSPDMQPDVIQRARTLGLEPLPGVLTATEAFGAVRSGARMLKLFPASTAGPSHLKALRAVLPTSVLVFPVGGVGPQDFGHWLAAGASGFGLGSELYTPGLDTREVAVRAAQCVRALKAKTPPPTIDDLYNKR